MSHKSRSDRNVKEKHLDEKALAEAKKAFLELLQNSPITLDTQWRLFREEHKSNPIFTILSLSDSMDMFLSFMKELENKEIEEQKIKQLQLQKNSRKTRDNFRELLEEKQANGEITKDTTWQSLKPHVSSEPRYLAMLEVGVLGSKPEELFDDFVGDLEEKFKQQKKKVKELLEKFVANDYQEFEEKITSHPLYDPTEVEISNLKEIYQEIQEKAKRKREKIEKQNKRKALDNMDESLKRQRSEKTQLFNLYQLLTFLSELKYIHLDCFPLTQSYVRFGPFLGSET